MACGLHQFFCICTPTLPCRRTCRPHNTQHPPRPTRAHISVASTPSSCLGACQSCLTCADRCFQAPLQVSGAFGRWPCMQDGLRGVDQSCAAWHPCVGRAPMGLPGAVDARHVGAWPRGPLSWACRDLWVPPCVQGWRARTHACKLLFSGMCAARCSRLRACACGHLPPPAAEGMRPTSQHR
jgi:hypothetical protein